MTWWHVKILAFLRLADRIRVPSEVVQKRLREIEQSFGSSPLRTLSSNSDRV
jgi:hypothetical protein